jgi:hypothetical protein
MANTPKIRPMPLNIRAIRKKIIMTNIIVIRDMGLNMHPKTKKRIKGKEIINNWEKKIPKRRLNLLNGPMIKAGKVFQYFSMRKSPAKTLVIPDNSIILYAKNWYNKKLLEVQTPTFVLKSKIFPMIIKGVKIETT